MNQLYEVGGDTLYRRSITPPSNEGTALVAVQLSKYEGMLALWEQYRVVNDTEDREFDAPAFVYRWTLVDVFDDIDKNLAIEEAVDRAMKQDTE